MWNEASYGKCLGLAFFHPPSLCILFHFQSILMPEIYFYQVEQEDTDGRQKAVHWECTRCICFISRLWTSTSTVTRIFAKLDRQSCYLLEEIRNMYDCWVTSLCEVARGSVKYVLSSHFTCKFWHCLWRLISIAGFYFCNWIFFFFLGWGVIIGLFYSTYFFSLSNITFFFGGIVL